MKNANITPDLIRAALAHVPANVPRDQWAKVAMAIKSEFPDSAGFDLFDAWSQSAGEGYDPKATRSTWRSVKGSGGVGIGTLLGLAKANGFTLPTSNQAPSQPDPATAARLVRERAERQQADQDRQQAAHELAALEAQRQWDEASDTGESAYLTGKGVLPYGVRFSHGGGLFVPVRDADGKMWNLQRISPEKPASGGPDKLFLKGGRVSGLWHLIGNAGELASPSPDESAAPGVLLIAEGYATAASLHQATGHPVAVAFDAGKLGPVAKALRSQYPAALLVLCGDDDLQTFAERGHNPGRDKATAAARAVSGLAVFPQGLPDGGSDFNDLHQAAGLEAVRAIVATAITAHQAGQINTNAAQTEKAGKASQWPPREPGGAVPEGGDTARPFERFAVTDDGVFYFPPGDDSGTPRRVCGPLRVTGLARDTHDNQAALLLEFDTQFKQNRRWLMPLTMLSGDGAAYRAALLSQGFIPPHDSKRRGWLQEYLSSRSPDELVRHVPRVGWHGRCYVLPDETLGTNATGERIIFHSEVGVEANFSQRGSLAQWQQDLSRLCVGNSRAAFAVATAFAGPLLAWASGTTGGGFHYTGQTSIGKTTCFLLAASVWGKGTEKDPDSYMQKWRASSNGLEYQGEQHNDCTLILDELGQMDPSDAGAAAYMLADGMGKTRAKGAGGMRPKPTWRLLFLSSGELTLAQHMETVGKKMKGGQEVRLIPVPTEVTPGSALETFHEFDGGHELAGRVQHNAARCYGTAGRAWLEYLVDHTDGLTAALRERMDVIEGRIVSEGAAGQVKRGGRRFALVAAAGEMATAAGLTGWPEGEAIRAAKICFEAWVASRGGSGSSEVTSILRQVRSFIAIHGDSRFTIWTRALDEHAPKTINRAGFRRVFQTDGTPHKEIGNKGLDEPISQVLANGGTIRYYILPDVFRDEVCKGHDAKKVCEVLASHGAIFNPEDGRFSISTKLPELGKTRCYCILDSISAIDV